MIPIAPPTTQRSRRSTVSSVLSVICDEFCRPCRRAVSGAASRLVRPADRRIEAVLAGIIPAHAMIAERIAGGADCQRHLVGANRMADARPHFPARMHGRQWIDGHVQNTRDFRGPRLAVDPECNWGLAHPQILADQRCERGHRTTGGAAEDRSYGLGLP